MKTEMRDAATREDAGQGSLSDTREVTAVSEMTEIAALEPEPYGMPCYAGVPNEVVEQCETAWAMSKVVYLEALRRIQKALAPYGQFKQWCADHGENYDRVQHQLSYSVGGSGRSKKAVEESSTERLPLTEASVAPEDEEARLREVGWLWTDKAEAFYEQLPPETAQFIEERRKHIVDVERAEAEILREQRDKLRKHGLSLRDAYRMWGKSEEDYQVVERVIRLGDKLNLPLNPRQQAIKRWLEVKAEEQLLAQQLGL